MSTSKFVIGRGELLTFQIPPPKRKPGKAEVYSLSEAQEALLPEIDIANSVFLNLSKAAKPGGFVVAKMMLHPGYIAKSFFPSTFLRETGLLSVGSRTVRVEPRTPHKKKVTGVVETTELFIAGHISKFAELRVTASNFETDTNVAKEFARLEHIRPFTAADRLVSFSSNEGNYFEVGLHLLPDCEEQLISLFFKYAADTGFNVYKDLVFRAGQLLFVPVKGDRDRVEALADFTLVRVVRPMPKLRGTRPLSRGIPLSINFSLPTLAPISSEPNVAILDGGLPSKHVLAPWVSRHYKSDPEAADVKDYLAHGLGVTSAFLFGPIDANKQAQRPFSYVNHHRILDAASDQEPPLELYRTLGHIEEILLSRQYQFVNLSLGPDLPVEDTDVHAWTSVIDDLLSDGETFLTIAAGNNGERDELLGYNRIQVPSDCVNGVTVGAADRRGKIWQRASYSAIGPGRSPGRRKPDMVAFGGSPLEYFHVPAPNAKLEVVPTLGTSFAAPFLLRTAVGVRAILGASIHPLTIKALLVHTAFNADHHPDEVGWGKTAEDINHIITCPDGVARIIFQGELKPGKYLRAPIPLPKDQVKGKVTITASLCYASQVDPQDASAYTKAGLGITFRPDADKFDQKAKNPKSRTFFSQSEYLTEPELRGDLGKWETVLHASDTFLGSTLNNASFDVHYGARDSAGLPTSGASKIRYALVITLHAPKHLTIYDEILSNHKVLISLQPQISVPIKLYNRTEGSA